MLAIGGMLVCTILTFDNTSSHALADFHVGENVDGVTTRRVGCQARDNCSRLCFNICSCETTDIFDEMF